MRTIPTYMTRHPGPLSLTQMLILRHAMPVLASGVLLLARLVPPIITRPLSLNPISHVGWHPNSFQASTMTPAPISGPSASQRSSWHRGALPDHENHLVQSFHRCELSCRPTLLPRVPSVPYPSATIWGKSFHFIKPCLIAVPRQRGSCATHP
jgi:hypothetical protein